MGSMTRLRSTPTLFSAILSLVAALSFAVLLAAGMPDGRTVRAGSAVMAGHHHGTQASADREGPAEHRHGSLPCKSACCGMCLACAALLPAGTGSLPLRGEPRDVTFASHDVHRQGVDPAGLNRPPMPSRLA